MISKRSAVTTQAIIVKPSSPYEIPPDLKNVTIAVNFHAGSHYISLGMLGGYVERDEIKVVHVGGPKQRFNALTEGRVGAAAVMEPVEFGRREAGLQGHLRGLLRRRRGRHPVARYRSLRRHLPRHQQGGRQAQRGGGPYLHYLISEVPDEIVKLQPEDLHLPRLRYIEPRPYTAEEFRHIHDWMVAWRLLDEDSVFEEIVEERVTA